MYGTNVYTIVEPKTKLEATMDKMSLFSSVFCLIITQSDDPRHILTPRLVAPLERSSNSAEES